MLPLRLRSAIRTATLLLGVSFFSSSLSNAAENQVAKSAEFSEAESRWILELLPRSLQKKPRIDLIGLTEMTGEGRKHPTPSPQAPVYYRIHNSGYHAEGEAFEGKIKIPAERPDAIVRKALANAGYLEGDDAHPPTLAIFTTWGSHNPVSRPPGGVLPTSYWKNLFIRARLIGGPTFAAEFQKAVRDQADLVAGGFPDLGAANPINRFANRDDLTRELVAQVWDRCYYIVVSAYDGAALLKGERKLLWRTKVTTSTDGLSLEETVPSLINASALFVGRDIPVAEIRTKRLDRKGEVQIGTATVEEFIEDNPITPDRAAPAPGSATSGK